MEFKETREEYSMEIKYATTEDITAIAAVEAECFPPAEAATEKEFVERVKYYGKHFGLMYKNVAMHNEKRCVADDFSEKGT